MFLCQARYRETIDPARYAYIFPCTAGYLVNIRLPAVCAVLKHNPAAVSILPA